MKSQRHLILLLLLVVVTILLYSGNHRKGKDDNLDLSPEKPPAETPQNIWLSEAYDSASQVEDDLIRDELFSLLIPHFLRAGETTFALHLLKQIDNEPRKASAHMAFAVVARKNNETTTYRKHFDEAIKIADVTFKTEEKNGSVYLAIASTLIENGYIQDAVSISSPACIHDPVWDFWLEWFRRSATDQAQQKNIATAKFIASAIPWPNETTRTYIDIAEIQFDDNHKTGAIQTLQEAFERITLLNSSKEKAYRFSLIAAVFARFGDHKNAIEIYNLSQKHLATVDVKNLQVESDLEEVAKTYTELARTSCNLERLENAKQWLAHAETAIGRLNNDEIKSDIRGNIAEVWMSMNDLKTALAATENVWQTYVLGRIIAHPNFPEDEEIINRIINDLPAGWQRDDALLCIVLNHLDHNRIVQAEKLAGSIERAWLRDEAYRNIITKLCELDFIDQAIETATHKLNDPWTELIVFQTIGKKVAESRPATFLQNFLAAQSNSVRRSASYLGAAEMFLTKKNDSYIRTP